MLEQEYAGQLHHLVGEYEKLVNAILVPELDTLVVQARHEKLDSERADGVGSRVALLFEALRRSFGPLFQNSQLEPIADNIAQKTSNQSRAQLGAQVKAAVGVDVFGAEPDLASRLEAFAKENVALIKSIPAQMTDQLEQRVLSTLQSGGRAEDLADEIQERFQVGEDRATLIARDQIGKLNGQLARVRQQALGLDTYIWRTAGDERIRPEHEARDGVSFRWDDPPEDGNPGEPINCRCTPDPNVDQVLDDLEAADNPEEDVGELP